MSRYSVQTWRRVSGVSKKGWTPQGLLSWVERSCRARELCNLLTGVSLKCNTKQRKWEDSVSHQPCQQATRKPGKQSPQWSVLSQWCLFETQLASTSLCFTTKLSPRANYISREEKKELRLLTYLQVLLCFAFLLFLRQVFGGEGGGNCNLSRR